LVPRSRGCEGFVVWGEGVPSRELTYPPKKGTFEDDVPFPQVGYVSSLEGIH